MSPKYPGSADPWDCYSLKYSVKGLGLYRISAPAPGTVYRWVALTSEESRLHKFIKDGNPVFFNFPNETN